MMKNFVAAVSVGLSASPVLADNWPIHIANEGCKFEFVEKVNEWETYRVFEIVEHLPFPHVRLQIERRHLEDEATLSENSDNIAVAKNIICDGLCDVNDNDFATEQLKLFPLEVGNRVEIPSLQKVILEVADKRSSPYFPSSTEYHIVASVDLLGDGTFLSATHSHWWNEELGFFTEKAVVRNMTNEILSNTTCPVQ